LEAREIAEQSGELGAGKAMSAKKEKDKLKQ
jgi:hypothetical protein